MECKVTAKNIETAITTVVREKLKDTDLFMVIGTDVLPKTTSLQGVKPPEMTEGMAKLLEKSKQYKDDIKSDLYKKLYEQDGEMFLFDMARQFQSSHSEEQGVLSAIGEDMTVLALRMYPKLFDLTPSNLAIDKINKEFGSEIIQKVSQSQWKINIDKDLVIKYAMAQPGGLSLVMDHLRAHYLSQFTSQTLNLVTDSLWLDHPVLQDPMVKDLLAFMKKLNPSARVSEFEDLDVPAVSLIRDYIIAVRQGSIISELPHEVAHFFIELMPDDNPIKKEMMEKITDMPIYSKVYQEYSKNIAYQKNGKPDISKIKREAVAQQIGEYIKAAYQNKADEKYGKKRGWLKNIIHSLFKWLRKAFHQQSSPIYTEPVFDMSSPFAKAATAIQEGDIRELNINKVMGTYDSVFFSDMENNIPEGFENGDTAKQAEAMSIARALHTLAEDLKKRTQRSFFDYINKENMQGLKQYTNDPNNQDYNRIWDLINMINDASKLLEDTANEGLMNDIQLARAATRLAEVYREMAMIPEAINKVLKHYKATGTSDKLVNNIAELQAYMNFSDNYRIITDQLTKTLQFIKHRHDTELADGIYDKMIDSVGNSVYQFDVVDKQIMTLLKEHVLELTIKFTDKAFRDYRAEINGVYQKDLVERYKKQLLQKIEGVASTPEHLRRMINGSFGPGKTEIIEGRKIDISRLKDLSRGDYLVFLFTSPTLIGDPFVSTALNYFITKYAQSKFQGFQDSKIFADKVVAIKKQLANINIGWYTAEHAIQTVQPFYNASREDQKEDRRTLLSITNRYQFNYDKQQKLRELRSVQKSIDNLREKLQFTTLTPEEEKDIKENKLPAEIAKLSEMYDKYNDWIAKWSYRPYKSRYYELQDMLKVKRTDSEALKEWKLINKQLLILETDQSVEIVGDTTLGDSKYDEIAVKIAELQTRKYFLQPQIPSTEQDVIDIYEELYVDDEVGTARLRQQHKNKWIQNFINTQINRPDNKKTRSELAAIADEGYDSFFIIQSPTQAFYDKRAELFDQLSAIAGSVPGLEIFQKEIDELKDKEKLIKKAYRDGRGEVNVMSLGLRSIEKNIHGVDITVAQSLKNIDEHVDIMRRRMRLYNIVLSSEGMQKRPEQSARLLAYIDLTMAFRKLILGHNSLKPEDVQKIFEHLIPLTKSEAQRLQEAVSQSFKGDDTLLRQIPAMGLKGNNDLITIMFGKLNFTDISKLLETEDDFFRIFNAETGFEKKAIAEASEGIFKELNDLYSNVVTQQYNVAMKPFFAYYKLYLEDNNYREHSDAKDSAQAKLDMLLENDGRFITAADVEIFLGDGLFEEVLEYMRYLSQDPTHSSMSHAMDIMELIEFYDSLHKAKFLSFVDGELEMTYTPLAYMKRPLPHPEYTEEKYPRSLTRSKINDNLRTVKVNELQDPDNANVDINGNWLPLPIKQKDDETGRENGYWNEDYNKLKVGKTQEDKLLFQLLNSITQQYLQAQVDHLSEGERLDLVIPAKIIDKLEQKQKFIGDAQFAIDYVKNVLPVLSRDRAADEARETNYREDIGVQTITDRDIYTGEVLSSNSAKLKSRRYIPLERTSRDATSSIAEFMENVNEYTGKNMIAPIMKSFAEVFKETHRLVPHTNQKRSEVLDLLYKTKALDEVPKNVLNDPHLSSFLKTVTMFTSWKLMGDPIGGLTSFTSGTMQQIIANNFSKSEHAMYVKSGRLAAVWEANYEADHWKGSNWSLTTQLIALFHMMPEQIDISHHLSLQALYSSVRDKLMLFRSVPEHYMAIHVGLSVIMADPIVYNNKVLTLEEIYELDPVTHIIRLKQEYIGLKKDWDPMTGEKVIQLRTRLMQKYTLLQGNYFKETASYISTNSIGKLIELMKKYFAAGVVREWQGETLDLHTGTPRKGYMLAITHLLRELWANLRKGDFKGMGDYFRDITSRSVEKQALRRGFAELIWVAMFAMLAVYAFGYDDDDEDKNKKLKEMEWYKQALLLTTLRVQSELGTFIPVPVFGLGYMEMKRAITDPIALPKATIDNIMALGSLAAMSALDAVGVDFEDRLYYQNSKPYSYNFGGVGAIKDKGDSKFFATLFNTVGYTGYTAEPGIAIQVINQMQKRLK